MIIQREGRKEFRTWKIHCSNNNEDKFIEFLAKQFNVIKVN